MQVALARDSVGFSLMPQRLFRSSIPEGIDEVEVPDLNLLLVIKVQRSPYLHEPKHVAEALAAQFAAMIGELDDSPRDRWPELTRGKWDGAITGVLSRIM